MQPATNEILLKFGIHWIFNKGHVNFKPLGNDDTSITLATVPATTRLPYTEDYTAKLLIELTIIF